MERLGKYGDSGKITSLLAGKVISHFETDGIWLTVVCADGHRARIGWQDASGNKLKGEAFIENLDVRLILPGATLTGRGNSFG